MLNEKLLFQQVNQIVVWNVSYVFQNIMEHFNNTHQDSFVKFLEIPGILRKPDIPVIIPNS